LGNNPVVSTSNTRQRDELSVLLKLLGSGCMKSESKREDAGVGSGTNAGVGSGTDAGEDSSNP
jgi:hypothetical protein